MCPYLREGPYGPGRAPQGGGEVGHAGVDGGFQDRGLEVVDDALVGAVSDADHDASAQHAAVPRDRLASLHPEHEIHHNAI